MGLLNTKDADQLPTFADGQQFPDGEAGLPFGRMYVYNLGGDTLAPVYEDRDLTSMIANPVIATASGRFPLCYLVDGRYRVVFHDANDTPVIAVSEVAVARRRVPGQHL